MTETMMKANNKVRQLAQDHPIEYVVACAAVGYFVGRILRSTLED